VEPADRIATFDNDGTLWVEKPAPPQADFLVRAWTQAARDNPSLGSRQPYKALIEQDMGYFRGLVTQDPRWWRPWKGRSPRRGPGPPRMCSMRKCATGSRPVIQPKFKVGYTKLVYKPMLELFDLLKAHDFRVFVRTCCRCSRCATRPLTMPG
jgi:hypothetical protein